MGKGLFFTGTILKNNRDILKEEAVRQQLALSQERLDLQNEEFARRRQEARRKADMDLYNSLDITGAGNYRDYFIARQKEILEFSAKNADAIYSDPTSDAAVQLINMQNNFKGDLELAGVRGRLYNSHQINKSKGDTDVYKINNDGSFQYESREKGFMEAINKGKSFSDANNLFDISASSVINKTEVDPFKSTIDLEFSDQDNSSWIIGKTKYTGYNNETLDNIKNKFTLNLSPDENGNFSDSYYKDYYLNGRISYIDTKGELIQGDIMDAFFIENQKLPRSEPSQELKLRPQLDDGSKNPDFDRELSRKYVDFITSKQMNRVVPPPKTEQVKPTTEKAINYFNVVPDEILDKIQKNESKFKNTINGIPFNEGLYDVSKGTSRQKIDLRSSMLLDEGDNVSEFNRLARIMKLDNNQLSALKRKEKQLENKNLSDKLRAELKREIDGILQKGNLGQATLEGELSAVTKTQSGEIVGIVNVGKDNQFLVPLNFAGTGIDKFKSGTQSTKQSIGYYLFRQAGIASGEADTSTETESFSDFYYKEG
jgi:hypothetical protein